MSGLIHIHAIRVLNEIAEVVPVFNPHRALIAVFDVDAATPNAFDEEDRRGLERMLRWYGEK